MKPVKAMATIRRAGSVGPRPPRVTARVATEGGPGSTRQKPSRLWLWFVAAFALQLGAWATWFVIASHHQVAEVPLATSTGR
jgi:hypothetical protein